jgi:hypothetical protein
LIHVSQSVVSPERLHQILFPHAQPVSGPVRSAFTDDDMVQYLDADDFARTVEILGA